MAAKAKAKLTPFIARKKLIIHCLKSDWQYMKAVGVFVGKDKDGAMIRLNIRSLTKAVMEKKVPLTDKEQETSRKNTKWVILEEADYSKVKLIEGGQFTFNA